MKTKLLALALLGLAIFLVATSQREALLVLGMVSIIIGAWL